MRTKTFSNWVIVCKPIGSAIDRINHDDHRDNLICSG